METTDYTISQYLHENSDLPISVTDLISSYLENDGFCTVEGLVRLSKNYCRKEHFLSAHQSLQRKENVLLKMLPRAVILPLVFGGDKEKELLLVSKTNGTSQKALEILGNLNRWGETVGEYNPREWSFYSDDSRNGHYW